jgi:hypothetical protein
MPARYVDNLPQEVLLQLEGGRKCLLPKRRFNISDQPLLRRILQKTHHRRNVLWTL